MCGICGIINTDSENTVAPEILVKMNDVMTHRGPDDEGTYINNNVGLGFRRLSIIDLAGGHQPMANEDDSIWIVFNGEIYNHTDLRKELISKGHIYKTQSDTETIIHLFEEEDINCFSRLNGMFSCAIWDNNRKRLVIARDRLGIKPLYFTASPDFIIFASEIKAILENHHISREFNKEVLEEFITFRFVAGENTCFKGIRNLLPGHILIWENGDFQINKFWDVTPSPPLESIDEATALDQFEELLEDSVKLRLMSDVPLGTMCSGGIDSGLTTAYATEFSNFTLNTFSVGFQEAEYDESRYALQVAQKYQTHHHPLQIDNKTFADSLPKMIWYNDEPLNHPNSIQIFHLSKLAKQIVTVLLTGEGADELFAGYPRYQILKICGRSHWIPGSGRQLLKQIFNITNSRRLEKLGYYFPMSKPELLVFNSAFVKRQLARSILTETYDEPFAYRFSLLENSRLKNSNLLTHQLYLDMKTYLVSILNRMDKMTMAAKVEGRVPFLDHRMVEWSFKLVDQLKQKGFQSKYIVKKLGEKKLPREIIHRQKSGFGVPLTDWLRDRNGMGRYLELFTEPTFKQRGYFKSSVIDRIVKDHLARKDDYSEILWEIINFELWHREFIDK